VSPMQYVVLSALWERDGQSGAELTARLRIDSATITGIIDRLVATGWVARARDAVDRRVQRVQLTEAGQSLREELEREMIDLNREIAAELGDRAGSFWTMLAEIGLASTTEETVVSAGNEGRKARRKAG
jgi:MarR family transcriptional regulator, organic hydroperoxide resistance regulator